MKSLSMTQPWATLLACGAKRIETRSWPARLKPGTLVAIHAARTFPMSALVTCDEEPFCDVLYAAKRAGYWDGDALPLGAVIAVARFTRCLPTDRYLPVELRALPDHVRIREEEFDFGNFAHGRFAFEFDRVWPLTPQPASGRLGFWDWDPPQPWGTLIRPLEPVTLPALPCPADVSLSELHQHSMAARAAQQHAEENAGYIVLHQGLAHQHMWRAGLDPDLERCVAAHGRCLALRRRQGKP